MVEEWWRNGDGTVMEWLRNYMWNGSRTSWGTVKKGNGTVIKGELTKH